MLLSEGALLILGSDCGVEEKLRSSYRPLNTAILVQLQSYISLNYSVLAKIVVPEAVQLI